MTHGGDTAGGESIGHPVDERTFGHVRLAHRVRFVVGSLWEAGITAYHAVGFIAAARLRPGSEPFFRWAERWGRRVLTRTGVSVEARVPHSVAGAAPCVFIANHQNSLDIPALAMVTPVPFGFVAKMALRRVPFLGAAIAASPSVFVDRSDPRRTIKSLHEAARQIREGRSVLVFPEGERSFGADMGPFLKRAFALASEAGVPVVPITIVDAFRLLDERHWAARPGTVRIVFHEPVPTAGSDRRSLSQLMQSVHDTISGELRRQLAAERSEPVVPPDTERPPVIDAGEVRRIAELARIRVDPADEGRVVAELGRVLEHMATLDELDLDETPPFEHVAPEDGGLRSDEVGGTLSNEEALRNAPDKSGPYFRVPSVIDRA